MADDDFLATETKLADQGLEMENLNGSDRNIEIPDSGYQNMNKI